MQSTTLDNSPGRARPFALRWTEHVPASTEALAEGVRFDPDQQVTVTADGTPVAATAFAESRTCGGMTGNGEYEIMDVWGTALTMPQPSQWAPRPFALGLFTEPVLGHADAPAAEGRSAPALQVTVMEDGIPRAETGFAITMNKNCPLPPGSNEHEVGRLWW